jgi:hypothetical protein
MAGVSDDERHLDQYCERHVRAGSVFTIALFALAVLLAGGCGSDEREFSAEEFVEEANSHGAGLELGEALETTDDAELYAVTVEHAEAEEEEHAEAEEPEAGHAHGGGSLKVAEDAAAAEAEYARCEETRLLFCYRAANVALVFQPDAEPDALGQVANALKAMQDD